MIQPVIMASGGFTFRVIATQTIGGVFSTAAGQAITVDWGDGTTNSYTGTDQAYSKNYGSVGNRVVRIRNKNALTKFTMITAGANINFGLSELPRTVTAFNCQGSNTVSGSLSDLPAGLTYFNCLGSNTVSGSLADLPAGLTYFYCLGSNTVSDYTTKTWTTKPATFNFQPKAGYGLSEAEINQLLIDFNDDLVWAAGNTITLTGGNAAPTGLGIDAKNAIIAEGATVTTN